MAACTLEHARPDNIVFFIETGFEFNQYGDLLAVFSSPCQSCDDGRIAAHPVQGLLDRQDIGIRGSLRHKVDDRLEGLIGVVHEDIAAADLLEDIAACGQTRNLLRFGIAVLTKPFKSVQSIELHQECQIQRALDGEYFFLCDREFLLQKREEPGIYTALHFQADGVAALSLFELLFDLLEQIRCFIFVNGQVCISRHAVGVGTDNIVIQKQISKVFPDDLLQENHAAGRRLRQLQYAGKNCRHLDCGELELFLFLRFPGCRFCIFTGCFIVFPFLACLFGLAQITGDTLAGSLYTCQKSADIQTLIANKGEGTGIVHCHRCQDREHLALEIVFDKSDLIRSQILVVFHDIQAIFPQAGQKLVIVGPVLLLHETVRVRQDGVELLLGSHACYVALFIARIDHILQGGNAHHEKFIQIGCGDAQELQSLKEGIVLVSGFAQTPAVKLQPAEFSVLIILRVCI